MASNQELEASCNICLDTIKGRNKPIQCPKCQQHSCSKCIQTFMLNEVAEPHCPNCRYGWTRRFLHEHLTRSFLIGPWASHRRSILWERDQAYMPEAQIHVERIKQSRELEKDLKPLVERRAALYTELDTVNDMIVELQHNIYRLQNGIAIEAGGEAKEEARKFVRKCMLSNCPGFLSTSWKCGICDNYTCKECLVVRGTERDAEHTCIEADLATARLIAKDTKPCPKCGEGIYRSEGCSHMFCTACKTAFNWTTMKIQENGYIDNPHYFAYAQANGIGVRNPGADAPCGGLPSDRMVDALISWLGASNGGLHGRHEPPEYHQAYSMRRCLAHMFGYVSNHYNSHNIESNTTALRVKYLMNELTKEEVQRQLLNLERKRERHRAIREVIDTLVTVGSDLFRNYEARAMDAIRAVMPTYGEAFGRGFRFRQFWIDNKRLAPIIHKIWIAEWKKTAEEMQRLREYCNAAFADVSRYYTCVVPQIDETFHDTTARFNKDGIVTKKMKSEAETVITGTQSWDSDSESI
jgi:hypothetical protein